MLSKEHRNNTAVTDLRGVRYTYEDLYHGSNNLAHKIRQQHGDDIKCVANFNAPGFEYVITSLAAWHLNAAVVPLCITHTTTELKYFVDDSESSVIVTSHELVNKVEPLNKPICEITADKVLEYPLTSESAISSQQNSLSPSDHALILYTSGTTGMTH